MAPDSGEFKISSVRSALVTGASSGIGKALCHQLLERGITVTGVSRSTTDSELLENKLFRHVKADLSVEDDVRKITENFGDEDFVPDLVINAAGFLHNSDRKPERQLKEFDPEFFLDNIKANTLPTALLAKHLFPFLRKKSLSAFITVTAKVGSISDNRMGGWHSYRASKAAANMMLKNISLEFQRMNCNSICLAIHPGTTVTPLSEPFTKNFRLKLHTPKETARNILSVIEGKTLKSSGGFYSWDGSELPW